jgi:hypothetical protein
MPDEHFSVPVYDWEKGTEDVDAETRNGVKSVKYSEAKAQDDLCFLWHCGCVHGGGSY